MKRFRPLAFALVLLGLALGLTEAQFHWLSRWLGGRSLEHRELAMQCLGEYLARQYPGRKAVALSNPFSRQPRQPREVYRFEQAGLRGLRRGLGKALTLEAVVFPELKPGFLENPHSIHIDSGTTTPLSYGMTDAGLDAVVRQHPQAEIVVSLIGLPVHARQTEAWKRDGPRFALLLPDLRLLGSRAEIRDALRRGKLAAFVLNKPGAPPEDQPLAKDARLEFDRRFLLVTPETVDSTLKTYPRLF